MTSVAHAAGPRLAPVRLRLTLCASLIPALALAEALAALGAADVAVAIDVALVLALANGVLLARSPATARLLCALALVPLVRPIVMATSIDAVPPEYWPVLAGVPLLVAGVWAARTVGYPLVDSLTRSTGPGLLLALLCAPALGFGAYMTAGPPAPESAGPGLLLAGAGVALVAAPAQEVLFRGVLQRLVADAFGRRTVLLVALNGLFATTLLGVSFAFALYMGAVGMIFSCFVRSRGSLGEVVVAQAGLGVFGLLGWPLLLG